MAVVSFASVLPIPRRMVVKTLPVTVTITIMNIVQSFVILKETMAMVMATLILWSMLMVMTRMTSIPCFTSTMMMSSPLTPLLYPIRIRIPRPVSW